MPVSFSRVTHLWILWNHPLTSHQCWPSLTSMTFLKRIQLKKNLLLKLSTFMVDKQEKISRLSWVMKQMTNTCIKYLRRKLISRWSCQRRQLNLNLPKKMRNRRNKNNHSLLQRFHRNKNSIRYLMRLRCDSGKMIHQGLKRRGRRRKLTILVWFQRFAH